MGFARTGPQLEFLQIAAPTQPLAQSYFLIHAHFPETHIETKPPELDETTPELFVDFLRPSCAKNVAQESKYPHAALEAEGVEPEQHSSGKTGPHEIVPARLLALSLFGLRRPDAHQLQWCRSHRLFRTDVPAKPAII